MTRPALTHIGKYEVEAVIGEGAMGIVYRAVDRVLNRPVAIKIMSDAIAQDADLRERFLREAQAAGSLQHPHVVTIYDFGEVEGHLYIAMEFVEGEDLEDLMERGVEVPLDAKLELMIGVLQGLAFAHKRGVIHRDIKPANIRIDAEGKARLMDFGVAHLSSSKMTRTGTMLGTPSYMAPEQIVGGHVTPQTDIFSAGAVLYELVTGVRPFRGDTLQALMYQILSLMPPPCEQHRAGLPPALNAVIQRAMRKEAKERYANATEMADELAAIRADLTHDGHSGAHSLRITLETAIAGQRAAVRRRRRTQFVRAAAFGAASVLALATVAVGVRELTRVGADAPAAGEPVATRSAEPDRFTGSDSLNVAAAPPETVAPDRRVQNPPADPSSTVRGEERPRTPTTPANAPAAAAGPSEREVSLARSVRDAALESRRRAVAAGATAEQLRAGDVYDTDGQGMLRRGDVQASVTAFNNAGAEWTVAERTARQSAADRPGGVASGRETPAAPNTTVVSRDPPPVTAPPPSPRPVDSARAAPAPELPTQEASAREIARIVDAYARAIQARDIAALRRVHPAMSADERTAFEEFFRATRSLLAELRVDDLEVSGTTARARLAGTYAYVTTAGTNERRPVSFVATFRYEGGAWTLAGVR